MATQTLTKPKQDQAIEQKIKQFRDLFADAPELGKKALENALQSSSREASDPPPPVESAGRVGARLGKVSELTIIVPLAPGGAKRLRAFLRLLGGNLSQGANKVGTLHTMRFVFFDNDTRLLFATAFDGDWDAYIDDFVAKIPDYLDIIDSAWDGWPGIRSPGAKDYLVKHQITAEGWYVAYPDLTVAEIQRRAHRQGGGRVPRQGRLSQPATRVDQHRKEKAAMATQTATANRPKQGLTVDEKIQKLRELYADAPEMGKAALENGLPMLTEELAAPPAAQTAGRIGAPSGQGLGAHACSFRS